MLAPSREVPATVHHRDGHVMSFWTYLRPACPGLPDEANIGSMLRDLHAALRAYPGSLPVLAPLGDIPAFLARPQTLLSAADVCLLTETYTRLTGDPVDPVQLRTCEQLRRLHLTIWYALYAERLPECRQRAAELLATWRTPSP